MKQDGIKVGKAGKSAKRSAGTQIKGKKAKKKENKDCIGKDIKKAASLALQKKKEGEKDLTKIKGPSGGHNLK